MGTAKKTVGDAQNGDSRALGILAGSALALLGGIALILRRKSNINNEEFFLMADRLIGHTLSPVRGQNENLSRCFLARFAGEIRR